MNTKLLFTLMVMAFGVGNAVLAQTSTDGQSRLAKEERERYVQDSLLRAALKDSLNLTAKKDYVLENYVQKTDSRLTDSRVPKGAAGGDLTGSYPNPTIKSSVALPGAPTTTTPTTTDNSTKIATTAYVKSNLSNYVTTSDSRLTDSRVPKGTAGGDLTGSYPNPTIKSSVALPGAPTTTTPTTTDNSTKIATTAYVKSNLASYATNTELNKKLPLAGGEMTGALRMPTTSTTSHTRYISAGGGYGANVGKNGLKILAQEQSDAEAGIGCDLTGYSYETCLTAPQNPSNTNHAYITFAKHKAATKEYTRLAELNGSGDFKTVGVLNVSGTGESKIAGNLRLKGTGNYGNKLNFGDGEFVYLHEESDDNLTIKAKSIALTVSGGSVTAPTPATTDKSTKVATTEYVHNTHIFDNPNIYYCLYDGGIITKSSNITSVTSYDNTSLNLHYFEINLSATVNLNKFIVLVTPLVVGTDPLGNYPTIKYMKSSLTSTNQIIICVEQYKGAGATAAGFDSFSFFGFLVP